jgi:hypothetical protein
MNKNTTFNPNIPINTPLIDSFTLRIPFDKCKIIDARLTSYTLKIYEQTGEISKDLEGPKPIRITTPEGITLRIGLAHIPIKNQRKTLDFITLTVTTKLLKQHYFKGINLNTIKIIYDHFISLKVFKCTYKTFLNSQISDIDINVNRYVTNYQTFRHIITDLNRSANEKQRYFNIFKKADNTGVDINTRYKATPSLPYIKLYHKQIELETKSLPFNLAYLQDHNIENLIRVEMTIKNHTHKKYLVRKGIITEYETLYDFLNIPQEQLLQFLQHSIQCYTEKKVHIKSTELSSKEQLLYKTINYMRSKGETLTSIMHILKSTYYHKNIQTQKRMRRKHNTQIRDIYLNIKKQLDISQLHRAENKEVNDFFNYLNIA